MDAVSNLMQTLQGVGGETRLTFCTAEPGSGVSRVLEYNVGTRRRKV